MTHYLLAWNGERLPFIWNLRTTPTESYRILAGQMPLWWIVTEVA